MLRSAELRRQAIPDNLPWYVRLLANRSPLGFNAGDTNLYRYVGNSPLNFVDPTGLLIKEIDDQNKTDPKNIEKLKNDDKRLEETLKEIIKQVNTLGDDFIKGYEKDYLKGKAIPKDRVADYLTFREKLVGRVGELLKEVQKGYNVRLMCDLPPGRFPGKEDDNRCWQPGAVDPETNEKKDFALEGYFLGKDREKRLIRICPAYFAAEENARTDTLIHELSHLFLRTGHRHWSEAESARDPTILLDSAYFYGQFSRPKRTVEERARTQMKAVLDIIIDPRYNPGTVK